MATPDASSFTPTPIRYRVWTGTEMIYPDDPREDVKIYPDGSQAEIINDAKAKEFVPLLSTGLHDAEGREVFDGDRVRNALGQSGVVFWDADYACWRVRWTDADEEWMGSLGPQAFAASFCVEGHVYESR